MHAFEGAGSCINRPDCKSLGHERRVMKLFAYMIVPVYSMLTRTIIDVFFWGFQFAAFSGSLKLDICVIG